ncbi:alkene reductase [Lentisphaera profundi]|uniref:Alkene reductase n=1 Tax=Lentisphaera profundi TaxID=1658616 RepID=A0ABY7VNP2_9BACT|nr:alkene reductase [Lentisphaera profundi]WDE95748.1 alkene reductase [Lentisphaera profundi]
MTKTQTLFQSYDLQDTLKLKNRIVMAPLTRCMATDELVPTQAMADYYARRADAGLIISEATLVSQDGQGYPNAPGLYTEAQVAGWKKVTQAIHQNKGKIFAQIWHTGRVSHSIYHQGQVPMAPSAIRLEGRVPRTDDLEYETPRAMNLEDIERIKSNFVTAAKNAQRAGFDGIEIHGANGYLIDQFLHRDSNHRTDSYGGSIENMMRFLLEILTQVKAATPDLAIGLRLSPQAYANMKHDDRDKELYDVLLSRLNQYNLAYIHTGMFNDSHNEFLGGTVTQYIRKNYLGTVIASGGYSADDAVHAIENKYADLVAIGRPFIANHDYVTKIQEQKKLVEYDPEMLTSLY